MTRPYIFHRLVAGAHHFIYSMRDAFLVLESYYDIKSSFEVDRPSYYVIIGLTACRCAFLKAFHRSLARTCRWWLSFLGIVTHHTHTHYIGYFTPRLTTTPLIFSHNMSIVLIRTHADGGNITRARKIFADYWYGVISPRLEMAPSSRYIFAFCLHIINFKQR